MQAAKLDRLIAIEQKTITKDSYGADIETWDTLVNVWAEKKDARGREFFSAAQVTSEIDTLFRIRYLDIITTQMRINYDSKIYDIYSIAEIGRGEGLEIMAKAQGV